MNKKSLLKHLVFLVFFVFIVNFLANKFYWYSSIWYFDMIMHTLGGMSLGMIFMYLFPPKDDSLNSYFKILIFTLFVGIAWEAYEFLFYTMVAGNVFNQLDTISDLFFDLAGGAMASLYFLKKIVFVEQSRIQ